MHPHRCDEIDGPTTSHLPDERRARSAAWANGARAKLHLVRALISATITMAYADANEPLRRYLDQVELGAAGDEARAVLRTRRIILPPGNAPAAVWHTFAQAELQSGARPREQVLNAMHRARMQELRANALISLRDKYGTETAPASEAATAAKAATESLPPPTSLSPPALLSPPTPLPPPDITSPPVAATVREELADDEAKRRADQQTYHETLRALRLIQGAMRRRRWRVLLSSKIPVIDGPCGMRAFPIFRGTVREGMEGPSGRQYRHTSLCCLRPSSPLREALVFVVEWPWFDHAVLAAVLANCILLGVEGAPPPPAAASSAAAGPPAPPVYAELEWGFTLFFSAELLLRIAAMGFAGHPHAYLADGWNRLDFVIVSISWAGLLVPSLGNLSGARALRALRPLRTVTRVPGLRRLVLTLLDSSRLLLDVAILTGLVLVVFGILGVQVITPWSRLGHALITP